MNLIDVREQLARHPFILGGPFFMKRGHSSPTALIMGHGKMLHHMDRQSKRTVRNKGAFIAHLQRRAGGSYIFWSSFMDFNSKLPEAELRRLINARKQVLEWLDGMQAQILYNRF